MVARLAKCFHSGPAQNALCNCVQIVELDSIMELEGVLWVYAVPTRTQYYRLQSMYVCMYRTCLAPIALHVCFAWFGNGGSASVLAQH